MAKVLRRVCAHVKPADDKKHICNICESPLAPRVTYSRHIPTFARLTSNLSHLIIKPNANRKVLEHIAKVA